ncbi:MAG TPA: amino acid permease [Acidimicrobiales bacterium]|nr:amino acid permease [Acidimicrobiales bacterium]
MVRPSGSGTSEPHELARALSSRQIQLMAIGGAIGVGLFLGSASAIRSAGPAVTLCYILAGAVVFLMLRALGEMAMDRPISGSFASYAGSMIGPWAGFVTAWTYWLMWIATVMAEITAIGIYVRYFFPSVPQWLPGLIAVFVLVAINLVSVRLFGEVEFWFALVKIVAILTFVVTGLAVVAFGIGHLSHQASASNLWSHGGFFPQGILGPLVALQIVTYAFLGIEMIGVTAGEAQDPHKELPKAINRVAWRILLFYVASIAVIMMLIPWSNVSATTSPFVIAWRDIGIPAAAGILNVVVLTSALSSSNSGVFASARMLHNLAGDGHAPRQFSRLSRAHVPAAALLVSGLALLAGVLLNILVPQKAFGYITSVATVAVLWVWAMIVIAHLRYRTRVRAGLLPRQQFSMPGAPWTNYAVLAFILLVFALLFYVGSQHVALIAGAIWAVCVATGWWWVSRRADRQRTLSLPLEPESADSP